MPRPTRAHRSTVRPQAEADCCVPGDGSRLNRWAEALAMLLVVLAFYFILKRMGAFSLSAEVGDTVALGAVFTVGLIAAGSTCLAVVGGLFLSVSAAWNRTHASTTGTAMRPMLLFNIGRLAGYFLLGGLVGQLGTAISLGSRGTGVLTIIVAAVMILLGINILQLVPKRFCTIPIPPAVMDRIRARAASSRTAGPLLLGALTFFLPCGFTQSMQLVALGSGGFWQGGVIMLVFALGTLPSLLGISLAGSLTRGTTRKIFLSFAGTVVLLLGFVNLQSGLYLSGIDPSGIARAVLSPLTKRGAQPVSTDPYVTLAPDGRQVVTVYVSDHGYSPDVFTIQRGLETWIRAIAPEGVSGCVNFLVAPAHALTTVIKKGENWLGPIPNPQADFVITCSMGMYRASIRVR